MEHRESSSLLEALRARQAQVRSDTWNNEPALMGLLQEALNLYWDCFSRLRDHKFADDVEKTLAYLGAAAFQTVQSCFNLIELGHYRQAAVLIRLLMNEFLLCNKFRLEPESAATFMSGSDWAAVQLQGADLLPRLVGLKGGTGQLASHLSTALQERLSWTAYVAAQELVRCPDVPDKTKGGLKALLTELRKDRTPGMSDLLEELGRIGVSRDNVLEHRFHLELLHRHAHATGVTVRAEVEARDTQGGQWMTPRYERERCRYCGYWLAFWSTAVLEALTDHFKALSADEAWTRHLMASTKALRTWGREANQEQKRAMA